MSRRPSHGPGTKYGPYFYEGLRGRRSTGGYKRGQGRKVGQCLRAVILRVLATSGQSSTRQGRHGYRRHTSVGRVNRLVRQGRSTRRDGGSHCHDRTIFQHFNLLISLTRGLQRRSVTPSQMSRP